MGDLLRNFGPYGIFLGMIVLGAMLSLLYESLINNQKFSFWRTSLYYAILGAVSYEGFYGTLFPNMIRYGVITIVGIYIIKFIHKRTARI